MNAQFSTPPPTPTPEGFPRRKSPGLAVIFSFLPGLGHVYLGLHQRGVAFFAAFLASIWLVGHADLSGAIVVFLFLSCMIDAYQMATNHSFPSQSASTARPGNLVLGLILLGVGALALFNNFYPLDLSFLQDWWPVALLLLGLWLVVADLRARAQRKLPPPSQ